jgi:uncharacterized membrane protein
MLILKKFLISFFIDNPYIYYFMKCHQLSERSFFIDNRQFQVCARCTGIILGIFFGIMMFPIYFIINPYYLLSFVFLSTIFISIDGLTQLYKLRKSNNILRLSTGIFWGVSYIIFIYLIIRFLFRVLHL